MKFLHTSDWHVGRTLNGWSLLEEQEWAFEQIVKLAIAEKVDGVVIVRLPQELYVQVSGAAEHHHHIYNQFVIRVRGRSERDRLRQYLLDHSVDRKSVV